MGTDDFLGWCVGCGRKITASYLVVRRIDEGSVVGACCASLQMKAVGKETCDGKAGCDCACSGSDS